MVAKNVADELGLRHAYCDPDSEERLSLNIQRPEDREPIWMARIQPLSPNETSIIFVCGAEHSVSFQSLLERNGLHARIHCQDWTETPQAQLSEDEHNEWRQDSLAYKFAIGGLSRQPPSRTAPPALIDPSCAERARSNQNLEN